MKVNHGMDCLERENRIREEILSEKKFFRKSYGCVKMGKEIIEFSLEFHRGNEQ